MSDTKEVKIAGAALVNTRRRNRKQKGGEQAPQIDSVPRPSPQVSGVLQSNFGPSKIQQFGGNGVNVGLSSTRSTPGQDYKPVVSGISPSGPATIGGGITLAPRKKHSLSLKPKKGGSMAITLPTIGGTRKARKIHLGVKGVTSRLLKAKKVKKNAMSLPIAQVRAKLEAAGVIKKSSKAPEAMLRTMYANLLITKIGL
jgi:hypothetical protein